MLELYKDQRWHEILERHNNNLSDSNSSQHLNIVADAYFHTGDSCSAIEFIEKSLLLNFDNEWTRVIKFNIEKASCIDKALHELYSYLSNNQAGTETLFKLFVDESSKQNEFIRSSEINLRREEIKNHHNNTKCIALQCFNKPDVLEKVICSILNCNSKENFDLVIIQDYFKESDIEKYINGWQSVREIISKYSLKLITNFKSFRFIRNDKNFGTAPTCKKLLDIVANEYDSFIFIEDDCILSKDALVVASYFIDNYISIENYWYATCESINFNSKSKLFRQEHIDSIINKIEDLNSLHFMYGELNFVPSTCFISKSEIWKLSSNIRSFVRGPESLTAYIQSIGKKTIFPLVPRANDIGMTHELGYSVKHLSASGVKEHKNTYFMSALDVDHIDMQKADKTQIDQIYHETSGTNELL